MANELLKFRKGLYADLAGVAKSAGTIYVTTDEQAMYVDISDTQRIRLGETAHFADLDAFQSFLNSTTPPYDTRAFYYIEKENALLKWVSEGGKFQNKGNWKQINSTAGIEADLSALETELNALKTTVAGNTTNIGTNATAIEAIKTAIGNASDATGESLWAAINANKVAIESNDTDIENLGKNKLDKSEFETFKTTNAEAIKAVDDKVGTKTDAATADTAFGRIKALEDSNATKASQSDVNALKTTVYGGADLDQSTAADGSLVKKVAALETNSATKAELKLTDDKANTNATDILNINNKLGASTDASNTDTAFQRIEALEDAVGGSNGNSLGDRVTAVEKTLNGDTASGEQGLVKDVEDLEKALGNKENPATGTIYKEIADIKVKDGQQDTSIANLEKVLNGDAAGATQDAKDGVLKRLSEVEEQANATDELIGTKASGTTGDTLWAAVKDAQDRGAANASQIGTKGADVTGGTLWEAVKNAQSAASANSTEITNINNEIGEKPEGATTLWAAIQANATDIDTLERTISSEINAANGMTYKGGVKSAADVNGLTNIEIGDTYVATEYFEFTQGTETAKIYAGDLLVASGTETNGVITADLKWTVVNTGYIQSHEATLGVAAITKGAQINLNSYVSTLGGTPNSGDLGKVQIVSDNLIITSTYNDATKTSEIKINAVWGDFGASAT